MIEIDAVTRRFGAVIALEAASFEAPAGSVTAFVGANGAGKTTLLRILVGLDEPDHGSALIDGRRYADLERPAETVGVALETGLHPSRRALDHLKVYAGLAGVSGARAEECLSLVGLDDASRRRGHELSAGMRTRLRLAVALLRDAPVLILDEPGSGLDFDGVRWLRSVVRAVAERGGTVLMSSHDLPTMSEIADRAVFIDKGRVTGVFETDELRARELTFDVACSDPEKLAVALEAAGASTAGSDDRRRQVIGINAERIGDVAHAAGVAVYELRPTESLLEQVAVSLKESDSA